MLTMLMISNAIAKRVRIDHVVSFEDCALSSPFVLSLLSWCHSCLVLHCSPLFKVALRDEMISRANSLAFFSRCDMSFLDLHHAPVSPWSLISDELE